MLSFPWETNLWTSNSYDVIIAVLCNDANTHWSMMSWLMNEVVVALMEWCIVMLMVQSLHHWIEFDVILCICLQQVEEWSPELIEIEEQAKQVTLPSTRLMIFSLSPSLLPLSMFLSPWASLSFPPSSLPFPSSSYPPSSSLPLLLLHLSSSSPPPPSRLPPCISLWLTTRQGQ